MAKPQTKKAIARKVINADARRKNPRRYTELVNLIAEKASLSINGAKTYLQNFRSGKWELS